MGSLKPLVAFTGEDEDVLARTIYGEARGKTLAGMVAVAFVIINRAMIAADYVHRTGKSHRLFGDGTITSACKAGSGNRHQFSCWNDNDPNLKKLADVADTDPVFIGCKQAARIALTGGPATNAIGTSTYYYAPPAWALGKVPFRVIGHHAFFNNID